MFIIKVTQVPLKADLHGTTLSHTTSLQQAYELNCFLLIKPTTGL